MVPDPPGLAVTTPEPSDAPGGDGGDGTPEPDDLRSALHDVRLADEPGGDGGSEQGPMPDDPQGLAVTLGDPGGDGDSGPIPDPQGADRVPTLG